MATFVSIVAKVGIDNLTLSERLGSVDTTASVRQMELLECLGLPVDGRALVVSCTDFGVSYAGSAGAYSSMRDGVAKSAGLIVPGPWARQVAQTYRGEDIGVCLTLSAPNDVLRVGPITQAPSLLGGDGGFAASVADVWEHADLDEVRRECRAQIERALSWGFDVTHLSSHQGVLGLRPEFFDVALELAVHFALPLRLGDAELQRAAGFPFRELAKEEGVLTPDHIIRVDSGDIADIQKMLVDIPVGVTEALLQPAVDSDELRALNLQWEIQTAHLRALTDPDTRRQLEAAGISVVGYAAIRDAAR